MVTFEEWKRTWDQLGLPSSRTMFADLTARYCETHRAYHTLQHLRECFDHLAAARDLAERPVEIELALWFHDAIYDPQRNDNEERSAELAVELMDHAGADQCLKDRVQQLVLTTKHTAIPPDLDARLLVDIDLAILGAAPTRFDEYEQQVRQEYTWVPEAEFRKGRSRILLQFLKRPRLYLTDWFAERFEQSARDNLQRSLSQLNITASLAPETVVARRP